jgi:hypothetical protein
MYIQAGAILLVASGSAVVASFATAAQQQLA